MPDTAKASPAAVGVSSGLSLLALLFWALALALLCDLAGSDAAGRGYAQAYAAIAIVVLWALLAILAVIAWINGALPWPAALAALILIPTSGFVTMAALELLSRPNEPPFLWPIMIPALVPPLSVVFCFWALLPSMRAAVPAPYAAGFVWGATLVLCVAILPMQQVRERAVDQQIAVRDKYDADFATLPVDSPLWDWTPFLDTPDYTKAAAVLDRIRHLDRRQSDAEIMLDHGDLPLGHLRDFDLTPTPTICDKTRALLRKRVATLVPKTPNSRPYTDVGRQVADALAAMNWLVGYECSCDAESQAWQSMAEAYRNPGFDTVELARLRDPKTFGRLLREYPARFSMLTPKAHLKAWLNYADDKSLREQALAGARKLDHRTADAVEMLRDNEYSGWNVLKYLAVLDLETTAPLCGFALEALHSEFAKTHRPRADDPRPYSELLERLGAYEPLSALTWLAGHGCNAELELSEAEALVRTYQESPGRAAMLATLAQLHRKS